MSNPPVPGGPAPTNVRHIVLALLAIAPFCAYLTRSLSAANSTIAQEFRVSDTMMGEVIAGFALGYFFFQIPGGMLAGVFGVRLMLPLISLAWSGCALWSSVASTAEELRLSRIALGFAQAGLVPCCAKVLADWFPLARRGIASAVMAAAMQLGAITATKLTADLLDEVDWRHVLQGYAAAGIAWAIVFFFWFRNQPAEHRAANDAEQALIRSGRPASPASDAARIEGWVWPALGLLASVSMWAYFVQALFRAYAAEFFYSWCPAYLERAYGLTRKEAGELATWPLAALGAGSLLAGFLIDALLARTGSRWLSRSGSAFVGMAVCAGCFALATLVGNPTVVIVFLSVGALFMSIGGPATWAAGMDLGGRHTPIVFGAMNMMGNIGAYLCPLHVGELFDHVKTSDASWDLVLWLFAGINAAGAAAWLLVNPRRPIEEGQR